MAYGSVNIRLRPIKLAFLVGPNDRDSLLRAIEVNTFLWGGQYNPIIPAFKRRPDVWGDEPTKGTSPRKIIAGYLDNYDPDFIVPVGKYHEISFEAGNRKVIGIKDITSEIDKYGTPKYGIGLFEILRYFISKELKFTRLKPIDICFPDFGKAYAPFMASVFGVLSQNLDKILRSNFDEILGAKRPQCSISRYYEILDPDRLFLRRISSLYLKPIGIRSWGNECVFFLDASKILDVIDYWNLRAIGWNVLPIPKQVAGCERVKQLVVDFIEQNFYPINPTVYNDTTILKSRYITEDELKEFVKSLEISPPKDKNQFKYVNQHWYPRIWDEWAKDADHVICCQLEAESAEHDITDYEERFTFKTVDPKFAERFSRHGEPRFANEIGFSSYATDKDIIAQVIPQGDETLARQVGLLGMHDWRFSKRGIVYLSGHTNWPIHLTLPKAEDLFLGWLRLRGWDAKVSPPGRIAKQMLKQLDGIWGISNLANDGVIGLLGKMGEGKVLDKNAFWGEILQIANEEEFARDPHKVLQKLIDADMFQLGVEVQCPTCTQRSWYSITDFDYELRCLKCSEAFQIPSASPGDMKWSYRAHGPFSLPNRASGVYSVLLTLRFFSQTIDSPTTPIMSFTAKKGPAEIEVDLALFLQEAKFGRSNTHLIFAECKTYNPFEKGDIDRIKVLGAQFPGAILVFSTLRTSLTEKEKRMFRPFVNQGRRFWKAEHPFNPVLVLTGTELFSSREPPYCWENIEGKQKAFANAHFVFNDLIQLCDVSQQLYLDMKSWSQWLEERWARRRQKYLKRKKGLIKNDREALVGPAVLRRIPIDDIR